MAVLTKVLFDAPVALLSAGYSCISEALDRPLVVSMRLRRPPLTPVA